MQAFYTVRSGDSLFQISSRWQIPIESLIAANNLAAPYTIFPGQQLSMPPGVDTYRVKPGDTLYRIAERFGILESIIIEANQLESPYIIQPNQLLNVPPGSPYYVIQPGDTLYKIAVRYNVETNGRIDTGLVRSVNNLSSEAIFPGMKLLIPYAPPGGSGYIAYVSNETGDYDIWLYALVNGGKVQVTSGLGTPFSVPFWSPDSTWIAFIGKENVLYATNVTEGDTFALDQFTDGLGVLLSWSPNSQKLVYVNDSDIVLYTITTHEVLRISQPGATDVQWFPSGTQILFQGPDLSGNSQLYRMDIDETNKEQITQNTGGLHNNVRLSPNGLNVLYTTPGASISLIYILEIETGRLIEVQGGPLAKNYFPEWSPDSSTIAYSATAFEEAGYFSLIRTVRKRGVNDRTRSISNCYATPVSWSPDSRKIVYLSGCSNQGIATEMWLLDLAHPVPIRLLKGIQIVSFKWSPPAPSSRNLTI